MIGGIGRRLSRFEGQGGAVRSELLVDALWSTRLFELILGYAFLGSALLPDRGRERQTRSRFLLASVLLLDQCLQSCLHH